LALVRAAIGLASLFAIGFAVHKVRSTFRQLDVLKSAKKMQLKHQKPKQRFWLKTCRRRMVILPA
jgi:ribosomal protein S19